MKVLRSLADVPADLRGGSVTIGNFDGVHLGHARLVERLKRSAAVCGGPAVVFTFDPHPIQLLRPQEAPPPLTRTERKCALLEELGVDAVVVFPTDVALLQHSAAEFFQKIVVEQLGAKRMVEGPNFYFGRGREGDIRRLTELCAAAAVELEIVDPLEVGGDWVSSSRVRNLLLAGKPEDAAALLTRPYRLRGEVAVGARRGRTLGFPTANIDRPETLIPGIGVYAGWAESGPIRQPAAIHIGPNPTFGDDARKIEIHLLDFSGDLYGRVLDVEFHSRLREVVKFDSRDALVAQLQRDVAATRARCGG